MANGEESEVYEGEIAPETGALAVISGAEIDRQVATAKAYPRSITKFKEDALAMATLDQETAGRMYYRLKRRGKEGIKVIEGPSIRLAEVAVAAWGNTFWGSRPVSTEDKAVRCQGFAWDLERNNRRVFEVTRRITTAEGRRYSDDMILVTQQAASQIAARNAAFGVIPRVYVDNLVKKCKAVFIGDVKSISDKRKSAFEEYAKIGAKKADVLALAGKDGIDDLTIDDLIDLKGLLTAIEEGNTTLKEALAAVRDENVTEVHPETLSTESFRKGAHVEAQDDADGGKKKSQPKKKAATKAEPQPTPPPPPPTPPVPVEIEEEEEEKEEPQADDDEDDPSDVDKLFEE